MSKSEHVIKDGKLKKVTYDVNNKTKIVVVNGIKLLVYPISYLAYMLTLATKSSRTVQTVRKWETTKVIPSCSFIVGGKRFYHIRQIELLCNLAKETKLKQGRSLAEFSQRAWTELPPLTLELRGEAKR